MTTLLATQYVNFVKLEDAPRFQDGLLKGDIPELPFDFDPKSPDRLTGDEMHKLMFGHTIAGHVLDRTTNTGTKQAEDFKAGVPWSVTIPSDGSTWGDVADTRRSHSLRRRHRLLLFPRHDGLRRNLP